MELEDLENEDWGVIPIPGLKGHYEITSNGLYARSVDRYLENNYFRKGQLLTPTDIGCKGYPEYRMRSDGKTCHFRINRLVLLAHGEPSIIKDANQAMHYPDTDTYNNHIDNLEWGTRRENMLYRYV